MSPSSSSVSLSGGRISVGVLFLPVAEFMGTHIGDGSLIPHGLPAQLFLRFLPHSIQDNVLRDGQDCVCCYSGAERIASSGWGGPPPTSEGLSWKPCIPLIPYSSGATRKKSWERGGASRSSSLVLASLVALACAGSPGACPLPPPGAGRRRNPSWSPAPPSGFSPAASRRGLRDLAP